MMIPVFMNQIVVFKQIKVMELLVKIFEILIS